MKTWSDNFSQLSVTGQDNYGQRGKAVGEIFDLTISLFDPL